MILKTYSRLFVQSLDDAIPILEALVGRPTDLRFFSDDPLLLDPILGDIGAPPLVSGEVEQAAIGDFLVIAGDEGELARARRAVGPVIVEDLANTTARMVAKGASVVIPSTEIETGKFSYLRHPDGSLVEYVQWKPELLGRIIR